MVGGTFEGDPPGLGGGVFQIDLGQDPSVTADQAHNLPRAATWASYYLWNNRTRFAANFPSLSAQDLVHATAASYNHGYGGVSGNLNNGRDIDYKTANGNYGSNILDLLDCFK